ncbi:hypothetical protein NL676_007874 [Syzygium grande]|nr:hypothetical protein NL676_007874 [Syzygium grande]
MSRLAISLQPVNGSNILLQTREWSLPARTLIALSTFPPHPSPPPLPPPILTPLPPPTSSATTPLAASGGHPKIHMLVLGFSNSHKSLGFP